MIEIIIKKTWSEGITFTLKFSLPFTNEMEKILRKELFFPRDTSDYKKLSDWLNSHLFNPTIVRLCGVELIPTGLVFSAEKEEMVQHLLFLHGIDIKLTTIDF